MADHSDSAGPDDLRIGSFSADAPWIVRPEDMAWRRDIDALRAASAAEVPDLIARATLPPGTRFAYTGFLLGSSLLAWAARDRRVGGTVSRAGLSRRLRRSFEKLGPTYIKLGQILSSGEGIFPDELVSEFRKLRDKVPPEPFETVERTITEDFGRPVREVFEWIDGTPLAAASIAQVHAAKLQTGESVVVKVQRPTVAANVRRDLAAMSWIAPYLVGRIPISALANPPALVELFAETIVEELDFRLEAQNMLDVAAVLADTDERAMIVPRPHPEFVTKRVLVMERLHGFSFEDVPGMHAAGVDTNAVVRAGMVSFLEGAMLYGVFHGDLHGGNLLVQSDGKVALLDYGITGRLDELQRQAFLRLVMGATMNDARAQIIAFRDLGALPADVDVEEVFQQVAMRPVIDPTKLTPEELTAEMREIVKILLGLGAKFPKQLMLFIKDLLFLDGALGTLAPDVDLFTELTHVAGYFATRHGERIAAEVGIDPRENKVDLDGMRAAMGLSDDTEKITHRELQQRRAQIRKNFEKSRKK